MSIRQDVCHSLNVLSKCGNRMFGFARAGRVGVGANCRACLLFLILISMQAMVARAEGSVKMLTDLNSTVVDERPLEAASAGGILYFTIKASDSKDELWRSDGSSTGTHLIQEITSYQSPRNIHDLTNFNGILYFVMNDGKAGSELWRSDGVSGSTVQVDDIYPGATGSDPQSLVVVGDSLYFAATDDVVGREVWKSDGTAEGTECLKNIAPGSSSSNPVHLFKFQNKLQFICTGYEPEPGVHLWQSSGTDEGTTITIALGVPYYGPIATNNDMFFFYRRVDSPRMPSKNLVDLNIPPNWESTVFTLISSDGTQEGTGKIGEFGGTYYVYIGSICATEHNLYFNYLNYNYHRLVRSDGTTSGTISIGDPSMKKYVEITPFKHDVYYIHDTDIMKINDLATTPELLMSFEGDEKIEHLAVAGDKLYLMGQTLWVSDGTKERMTPLMVGAQNGCEDLKDLLAVESKLFFTAYSACGVQLWVTDGTETGTIRLACLSEQSTADCWDLYQ